MNAKTRQWLLQIFATKIGWLGISLLGMVVFGILANYYDWAEIAMYISLIYPVGLTLVMMAYAWVINPIRALKERKNK